MQGAYYAKSKLCKVQNHAKWKIIQGARLYKEQDYARCQNYTKYEIVQKYARCAVWKSKSVGVASTSSLSQHQSAFVQLAHPPAFGACLVNNVYVQTSICPQNLQILVMRGFPKVLLCICICKNFFWKLNTRMTLDRMYEILRSVQRCGSAQLWRGGLPGSVSGAFIKVKRQIIWCKLFQQVQGLWSKKERQGCTWGTYLWTFGIFPDWTVSLDGDFDD